MLNGFSPGPRKFTKLLKPPLAYLRQMLILIAVYIDDIITAASLFGDCFSNVFTIVKLLDSLGFVVHPDKSRFVPSQVVEYLGFIINSVTMTLRLTERRSLSIIEFRKKLR